MTDIEAKPESPPAPKTEDYLAREREFFERLRGLQASAYSSEKAKLSRLRRAAGDQAADNLWVYALLPSGLVEADENAFFLAATLAAFDRRYLEGKNPPSGNFGASLARMRNAAKVSPESVDRRFRILLDARFEWDGTGELPFRLRQMVKLTLSRSIEIDWPQLLHDLRYWNSPLHPRRVQKAWAKAYFDPSPATGAGSGTSAPDEAGLDDLTNRDDIDLDQND